MKNIIKSSKSLRLAILSAGLVLGMAQHSVYAAPIGTASGTPINNIAKLSYSVGSVAQNEICSAPPTVALPNGNNLATTTTSGSVCTTASPGAFNTTFTVDNKVNLDVKEKNTTFTTVVPGQQAAVTTFTVTNTGNTTQDYQLDGNYTLSGTTALSLIDNFQPTACTTFVDVNTNGVFDSGTDLTYINDLASGDTKDVLISCNIPTAQINNDVAVVQLTATTLNAAGTPGSALANTLGANTAGVDVVFADPTTTATTPAGTDPGQTVADGKGVALGVYKVVSAVLNVKKSVKTVCDPINGNVNPKDIPGAAVQYAITITNTGSASANLTSLTDTIDTNALFNQKLNSGSAAVASVDSTCAEGSASSLSATGFGAVKGTTAAPGYTAPGIAAQATTAGATAAGQIVTINYTSLAAAGITPPVVLASGDSITVYFNAFIK